MAVLLYEDSELLLYVKMRKRGRRAHALPVERVGLATAKWERREGA